MDRFALLADGSEDNHLIDGTRFGGAMAGVSFHTVAELAQRMRHTNHGIARTVDSDGVVVFSGKEAVDWLLNHG